MFKTGILLATLLCGALAFEAPPAGLARRRGADEFDTVLDEALFDDELFVEEPVDEEAFNAAAEMGTGLGSSHYSWSKYSYPIYWGWYQFSQKLRSKPDSFWENSIGTAAFIGASALETEETEETEQASFLQTESQAESRQSYCAKCGLQLVGSLSDGLLKKVSKASGECCFPCCMGDGTDTNPEDGIPDDWDDNSKAALEFFKDQIKDGYGKINDLRKQIDDLKKRSGKEFRLYQDTMIARGHWKDNKGHDPRLRQRNWNKWPSYEAQLKDLNDKLTGQKRRVDDSLRRLKDTLGMLKRVVQRVGRVAAAVTWIWDSYNQVREVLRSMDDFRFCLRKDDAFNDWSSSCWDNECVWWWLNVGDIIGTSGTIFGLFLGHGHPTMAIAFCHRIRAAHCSPDPEFSVGDYRYG